MSKTCMTGKQAGYSERTNAVGQVQKLSGWIYRKEPMLYFKTEGSQAGGPGRSWCCGPSPKAIWAVFLFGQQRSVSLFVLFRPLTDWVSPPTLWRTIYSSLNINLIQKHSYRNIQNTVWSNIWVLWLSRLTHKLTITTTNNFMLISLKTSKKLINSSKITNYQNPPKMKWKTSIVL